jgi:REP element-mobilizing transposase RayT
MTDTDIDCLVPWAEIEIHQRRLPHWQQGRVAVFVTWRLADALPQERLAAWRGERAAWLARHPQPWDAITRQTYAEEFGQTIDRWLDAGHGSCLLREPAARAELVRVLEAFAGTRYRLHAWVVMPNHVHVLFSPTGVEPADRTIAAWKGVSARRIHQHLDAKEAKGARALLPAVCPGARALLPASLPNRQAGVPALLCERHPGARALLPAACTDAPAIPPAAEPNRGRLWQPESWDTLIRSAAHFAACRRYIAENPSRARLAPADFTLWLEERAH